MTEERRKFLRVKKTFPFDFNLRGKDTIFEVSTFDISLGGIGFYSPIHLKPQDIIHLRIKIPGFKERLSIRGIIRWLKNTEDKKLFIGVEFFNIEDEEKDVILKALREG